MAIPTDLERMTVAQAMRNKVIAVSPQETLEAAARTMRDTRVTALAVIDPDSQVPGIITERDLGRAMLSEGDPRQQLVRGFETQDVIVATRDWSLERAARTMAKGDFRHLLVVEEGRIVGILSMRDIVRHWAQETDPERREFPDTAEIPTLGAAHKYLYTLRRSAKQHLVAAKCTCEMEWFEVLTGQLEDRPDLDGGQLKHMWDHREPCPALHAEGGGAD